MIPPMVRKDLGTRVSSSPADPHRIGPFGEWHFGLMAGFTLRGVELLPETLRARRMRSARIRTSHSDSSEKLARASAEWAGWSPFSGRTVIDRSGASAFGWPPFGNEKCCSLAYCIPAAPKARIGRGSHDEGSVGVGTFLFGRMAPASLVS